jgi:hypothetical protein
LELSVLVRSISGGIPLEEDWLSSFFFIQK